MILGSSEDRMLFFRPNRYLEDSPRISAKGFLLDPKVAKIGVSHTTVDDIKNTIQKLHSNVIDTRPSRLNPENFVYSRNKKIKKSLRETGLNIDDYLHPSTGAPYLMRGDLHDSVLPEPIQKFFLSPGNLLHTTSRILSGRGRHYYFQFPGIGVSGNPLSIKDSCVFQSPGKSVTNHRIYCQSFVDHYKKIESLRNIWVNHPEITSQDSHGAIPKSVKRSILVILDHEKNILLFLINVLTILLNSNFLNTEAKGKLVFHREQSRTLCNKNPEGYREFKVIQDELISKKQLLLEVLYKKILSVEQDFARVLMHSHRIGTSIEIDDEVQKTIELIEKYLNFLAGVIHIGKKTSKKQNLEWDIYWQIGVSRVMRFSREEDDMRSMLISAHSLAHHIIDTYGRYATLEIFGILYGGVEFPFILENTLQGLGFRGRISIRLCTYSMYDVKNITGGLTLSDYPDIAMFNTEWGKTKNNLGIASMESPAGFTQKGKETPVSGRIAVLLDDNIFSGDTLLGFEKLLRKTGEYDHVISQVSTIMLDVREKNRIQQDSRLLHKQMMHVGSVLPVRASNTGKYIHPLTDMIGKRVERVGI